MQTFDSHNRQRALHELGLGPMWLLREAEQVALVPALEAGVEVGPDPESGSVAAKTAEPIIVTPAPAPAPAVNTAWTETEIVPHKHPPEAPSLAQAFESPPEADDWMPQEVQPVPSFDSEPAIATLSWDELQPMVESCRQCGLCQGRKKAVFGTGDKQAKWLFVGEGPGYNENLQGLPFVGAAGQLLDNMLKSLGVPRGEQSYIANIVKCRPTDAQGKDRPPTADEIAACLPYLHRQIAMIKPQIIVALGKTAAVSLLGMDIETPVGQLRGKVHQFNGIPVVATYHPAYLLRKPADKAKAWADLCLAIKALPAH
ncbi:uracil-DNA glycosylase [Undibacterium sp. TC4M20W]|uniref:uracil-DNA glycosylase n=1 Tax=unclassified Undibacterium TaxID=2630295 RepID=UPI003BF2588E